MATASSLRIDDLVQSVSLHNPRKWMFNGYILPFVVLQSVWIYCWIFVYGVEEYYEAGLAGIAAIAVLQIFLCLCCQWSVHIHTFLNCSSEKNPYKATIVKVVPTPNNGWSELITLHHTRQQEPWFIFQKTKYCWNPEKKSFSELQFPVDYSVKHYCEWKGYLDQKEVEAAEEKYGKNKLDIQLPQFGELFKERAVAPFFVFQVFCVVLWCLDKYWYYSIFTLIMLVMFECTLVQQQLRNMAEIRKMGNKPYMIMVYRNRRWRSLFTNELVPGDIVSITRSQNDNLVPCDMLLLRGPCVVDESMLTGESVPQMKEPIEDIDRVRTVDIEGGDKFHVLFGGTKVVQHTPPSKTSPGLRATDNGCIAYVLRTGFSTSQGKLLRTILFGVKRVTANNLETFCFILFLLVFAIAAAAYVWMKGIEDPTRNKYKLFLECTLILTSVVPPELPIELSLAVNTSLVALSRLGVFCTEPFRIPFAGKVDICCFDKTGTLTSDNLVVEGVAGIDDKPDVIQLSDAPLETVQVLATCHSLVQLDEGIVGDPLEKATFKAVKWNLTKSDSVIPKKGKTPALKIVQRYHFSSALKRMCVVIGFNIVGASETQYMVTVKGAPETLKNMLTSVPENYDSIYLSLSRRGARVLALGYRKLPGVLSAQDLRELTREKLESNLTFAGFVIISCPLKPDSKAVIKEIVGSSHAVVMITGDNPLTACHVSRELHFTKKPHTLILTENDGEWLWESIDKTIQLPLSEEKMYVESYNEIWKSHALCVTGEGLSYLKGEQPELLRKLLPHIVIFARCAPKQKEFIIISLQTLGYTTLMCGDGTNDVGALKHAQVGIAILSSPPEKALSDKREEVKNDIIALPTNNGPRFNPRSPDNTRTKLQKMLKDLDKELHEDFTVVKLGDASIAAPFTSKMSSIQCICHVIKQGRCTLVTTLQMFKILALNALILAYGQSVLYLDGIKFSDAQATFQGILLAMCFLCISRSKPLKTLSQQRPLPNIFNLYTIATVFMQFIVHFACIIYLVREATLLSPKNDKLASILNTSDADPSSVDDGSKEEEQPFEPNLINSTVFMISTFLQVSTFAINYRGLPFMESLTQNKALLFSLTSCGAVILFLTGGLLPEVAMHFEIVDFPSKFRTVLAQILIADLVFAYIVDRTCLWLFGEGKQHEL